MAWITVFQLSSYLVLWLQPLNTGFLSSRQCFPPLATSQQIWLSTEKQMRRQYSKCWNLISFQASGWQLWKNLLQLITLPILPFSHPLRHLYCNLCFLSHECLDFPYSHWCYEPLSSWWLFIFLSFSKMLASYIVDAQ